MKKIIFTLMMLFTLTLSSCTTAQIAYSFEPDVMYYDNGYNYSVVYINGILNYRFFDDVLHTFYFRPVPRERYGFIHPCPRDFRPHMSPRPDMRHSFDVRPPRHHGPDAMPRQVVPERRSEHPRSYEPNRNNFNRSSTRVTVGPQPRVQQQRSYQPQRGHNFQGGQRGGNNNHSAHGGRR